MVRGWESRRGGEGGGEEEGGAALSVTGLLLQPKYSCCTIVRDTSFSRSPPPPPPPLPLPSPPPFRPTHLQFASGSIQGAVAAVSCKLPNETLLFLLNRSRSWFHSIPPSRSNKYFSSAWNLPAAYPWASSSSVCSITSLTCWP